MLRTMARSLPQTMKYGTSLYTIMYALHISSCSVGPDTVSACRQPQCSDTGYGPVLRMACQSSGCVVHATRLPCPQRRRGVGSIPRPTARQQHTLVHAISALQQLSACCSG